MATATFTEVVDRTIGDPITEAIWTDQIQDNLNQLAGAHRNLLTNGGFEVWQRGAGPFTTTANYTADRWQLTEGAGSAASVTQESSTIDSSGQYALACVYTQSANSTILQSIEHWRDLKGKTVSLSIRIRQTAASMVRTIFADGTATTSGSTTTTTGSFVTLTQTFTVSASATQLVVGVQLIASGTAYLDNAMLVIGPAPAPYQPLHPQEDLARCQRYYEVFGGGSVMHMSGYNAAGSTNYTFVPFAVPKGGVPTMTVNGTWATSNCGQPTTLSPHAKGFSLGVTVTALGGFLLAGNGADDTIVAEWNP